MKRLLWSVVAAAAATLVIAPPAFAATNYYVSPSGNDAAAGTSADPFATVQHAVDLAGTGDVIHLAAGTYRQDIVTAHTGVTITGPATAVLTGGGRSHVVQVEHHDMVLDGFTVDGQFAAGQYRDKLVFVDGADNVRIYGMYLRNASRECVHLYRGVVGAEVGDNHITGCGREGPDPDTGMINGEGIYVGTALAHQASDGIVDRSNDNWIHGNAIDTDGGSECVDIKERSTGNIVENTSCTGVAETGSGGIAVHGNGNIIRKDTVDGNDSSGVRLGGTAETDGTLNGVNNAVYLNTITNNTVGGIKFVIAPQGQVCGNTMSGNTGGDATGPYAAQFTPKAAC